MEYENNDLVIDDIQEIVHGYAKSGKIFIVDPYKVNLRGDPSTDHDENVIAVLPRGTEVHELRYLDPESYVILKDRIPNPNAWVWVMTSEKSGSHEGFILKVLLKEVY